MPHSLKRSLRLLSGVLALSFLVSQGLLAQSVSKLDLTVVSPEGEKLKDVRVVVTGSEGNTVADGQTNKKGKFTAEIAGPEGEYLVRLDGSGYPRTETKLALMPGNTTTSTIKMFDQAQAMRAQAIDAFNAGVVAIQAGDEEVALEHFAEAAKLDPTIADVHRILAALYIDRDRVDEAAAALASYEELEPGDPQVLPIAYRVYRRTEDSAKLEAVLGKLLGTPAAKDLAATVYNEGVAAVNDKAKEAALALFDEAAKLDPALPAPHQSSAALYFNDQEYEQAAVHLEKLLEMKPDSAAGWRMAFFTFLHLGERDQAATAIGKWLSLSSQARDEILTQARKLFEGDQHDLAQAMLELLLGVNDEDAQAHYRLGTVFAAKGNTALARQHLERSLEIDPSHPQAEVAKSMLAGL